ncbi:unnamed protein product [Oikopleura dioica]|uniref:Uncharacterized protein n=1 Tax=Oikopleura dioica TaxID=34765 RepID=E4X2Z5_OIKDI|nr:unnamed protein product [Oikopleura dioica]
MEQHSDNQFPTFGKIEHFSQRRIEQQMDEESRLEQKLETIEQRKKYCENAQRKNELAWANNNSLNLPANH